MSFDIEYRDCWSCGRCVPEPTMERITDERGHWAEVCSECAREPTDEVAVLQLTQCWVRIGELEYALGRARDALASDSDAIRRSAWRVVDRALEGKPPVRQSLRGVPGAGGTD